jgi:4-hydroxybenzoate polyprenyltransferase/phosphoserine phosphatase
MSLMADPRRAAMDVRTDVELAATRKAAVRPLVVDLDTTLVRTDTLCEALAKLAFKSPKRLPAVLAAIARGRAAFKRAATAAAGLEPRSLPYNDGVLSLIAETRQRGVPVHLATAADQALADAVALHLDVFESASGSVGDVNNKGAQKAVTLTERFDNGFGYAGDSTADIPVWKAASEVIVVNPSAGRLRRLVREGVAVDKVIRTPGASALDWAKALRLHHWIKNALILIPLFLSQLVTDVPMALRASAAFVLFGVVASATYLINDLSDLAADRDHPTKRHRAMASGKIQIQTAAAVSIFLLVAGLGSSLALGPKFFVVIVAYVVITLLYSFRLKREPILDVLVIGGLFTVRIVAGMVALREPISMWLSAFTLVLFTALALAKRNAELVRASAEGRSVAGRGYLPQDVLLTTSLGIATSTTATLVMTLYMALEAAQTGLYSRVQSLFLIPLILALWLLRVWVRAHRGTLTEDPVVFAIRDKVSWAYAALILVLWILAVVLKP